MSPDHIESAKMVDYTLGNLSADDTLAVERHLRKCATCQNEYEYWRTMLASEKKIQPSAHLNEKIRQIHTSKQSTIKTKQSNKWIYVISSMVAGILIIFMLSNMKSSNDSFTFERVNQGYIIAQQDEVPERKMLLQPATNKQHIVSLTNDDINGELWLNEETNEIFFHADGFMPLETEDYQLWVVHVDDYWNGQLLHLQEGSARVYYKAPDITLLKYLKVSVEPRGGSLIPTGPDILFVDLKEE